ncbi:MAG: protein kinase [Acidobacteriota bacterium]
MNYHSTTLLHVEESALGEGSVLGETISHYRIEERIGVGGMGEVFRAFDTQLERPVAIKRLRSDLASDPDYRRRFLREAQHAAKITHQGVAAVHDVVEKDGEVFLVMEYVEGRTLSKAVLDRSDISALLKVITKCAEALVAAHEIGVVHRDIKPANIMLTPAGEVKILDFGLAQRHSDKLCNLSQEETAGVEVKGKIRGTLAFMSPEVLRGRPADHRSDLFSLGVVFYQLLTGEYPFAGDTQPNLICNILNSNPVPIVRINSTVPYELEECVFRLLEKDRELRYASAEDLLAHLRKIERDLSFTPPHILPVPDRASWVKRHRYPVGITVLLLIGLSAFFVIQRILPPPIPENPVLAVIPFQSVSEDPNSVAFAAGLSEMVTRRLESLSLGQPFAVSPAYPVRRYRLDTPRATEGVGANLVLMGSLETRKGNVTVPLKLVSAGNARELRHAEIRIPLNQPADLEYQIVEKLLSFLKIGQSPPDREIIKSYPSSQAAYDYFLRGLGYYLSGEISFSIENFQSALQMEPHFELAMAYLGLALLKREDSGQADTLQNAERFCRQARELGHRLQVADFCLGEVASAKGDLDEAQHRYEASLQEGPLEYESLNRLLDVSDRLGRLDIMVSILKAAIEKQPASWTGYDYLAFVHYRLGDFESAVLEQKKAVKLAPKRASGYGKLAVFYDLLGCPQQVAESYEAALKLDRDSTIYTNLAATRYYAGRYAEALEAAQSAKVYMDWEKTPDYIVLGNLADVFYWAPGGNQETGATFYNEALEVVNKHLKEHPDDQDSLQCKCWYLAMLKETDSARECLATALAAAQLNSNAFYRVAKVYQRLGQEELAVDYLKRSLDGGKPVSPIHNELIFRGNRAIQELLASYPREQENCP